MIMALQHHWNILHKGGQVSTAFPTTLLPPSLRPPPQPSDGKSIMAVRPAKKRRKSVHQHYYKDLATQYLKNSQPPEFVFVPSNWRIDAPEYLVHASGTNPKKKKKKKKKKTGKSVRFATQNILGLAVPVQEDPPLASNSSNHKPTSAPPNPKVFKASEPAMATVSSDDSSSDQDKDAQDPQQDGSLVVAPKRQGEQPQEANSIVVLEPKSNPKKKLSKEEVVQPIVCNTTKSQKKKKKRSGTTDRPFLIEEEEEETMPLPRPWRNPTGSLCLLLDAAAQLGGGDKAPSPECCKRRLHSILIGSGQ